jgi:deoxyribodipyrimidine photo-lyase
MIKTRKIPNKINAHENMRRDQVNIFIHRRDFRVHDNTALCKLVEADPEAKVLHIFIFNPNQIDSSRNPYFSKNCVEFMVQSLVDLNNQLNDGLHCFHGIDTDVLSKLIRLYRVNHIAFNRDFTPFAKQRDAKIVEWCTLKGVNCITAEDYTLFPIQEIKTDKGDPYEVFTPFYKKCLLKLHDISESVSVKHTIFRDKKVSGLVKNWNTYFFNEPNHRLAMKGGRSNALYILENRVKRGYFSNYDKFRDIPSVDKTTRLSPYLKFGCVSIREVFSAVLKRYGVKHGLVRELFWREFYANIAYSFPHVLQGQVSGHNCAFKQKYDNIQWNYNSELWEAFIHGKTGFPLVDAGIRQLKDTGWCHNRSRMVVAMFASKDLHLPPNDIERWFAANLIDYDPSSNSGGVQWAYGIGSDAQPYFRIFNPFTQAAKYDKDAIYIKTYVQELKSVEINDIHQWETAWKKYSELGYPKPIVNHSQRAKIAKSMFQSTSS